MHNMNTVLSRPDYIPAHSRTDVQSAFDFFTPASSSQLDTSYPHTPESPAQHIPSTQFTVPRHIPRPQAHTRMQVEPSVAQPELVISPTSESQEAETATITVPGNHGDITFGLGRDAGEVTLSEQASTCVWALTKALERRRIHFNPIARRRIKQAAKLIALTNLHQHNSEDLFPAERLAYTEREVALSALANIYSKKSFNSRLVEAADRYNLSHAASPRMRAKAQQNAVDRLRAADTAHRILNSRR